MRLGLALELLVVVLMAAAPCPAADRDQVPVEGEHRGAVVLGQGLFRDCPDCPEMVVIPAGKFVMGSPADEEGRFDSEGPQHSVSLRWFALAKYDVTVREFTAFVHETGYEPGPCNWPRDSTWDSPGFLPADPVVCVSWRDAQAYIKWLNRKVAERSPALTKGDGPYRLPSEAEWEYAARAGTANARWWGDSIGVGNANCNGCGSPWDNRRLSPVGSFKPNRFGLYDMLGDVWQWTDDCWNETYTGAPDDGRPWTTGDCRRRVLRGGSWSSLPKFLRSAARSSDDAGSRSSDYASFAGFRVAMTLP
jgi:formylglycine-generating enzyme required for sulfatase activity